MTDLSSEASASGATAGPGRLIRRAREQASLSIEDLSAQIKLARGTLDALERDDFKTLSEPVYVRGYYRKLSKVLPVAEAELLSAYEAQFTPKAIPLPPSKLILSGESDLDSSPRVGSKLVIGVILVGLLLVGLAFWGSTRTAIQPAEVTPAAQEPAIRSDAVPMPESGLSSAEALAEPPADASGPTSVAPSTETPPVSATLTLAPSLSLSPPGASPAPAPLPVAAANSQPAAPPAAAPSALMPIGIKPVTGRAEVQLQFSSTSWTRIEDASGKSLLSGVIQAGDRQTLSGEAPFSIFLGNAPGVSIQFNGQQVDMAKYTKGNNTARFTLP